MKKLCLYDISKHMYRFFFIKIGFKRLGVKQKIYRIKDHFEILRWSYDLLAFIEIYQNRFKNKYARKKKLKSRSQRLF